MAKPCVIQISIHEIIIFVNILYDKIRYISLHGGKTLYVLRQTTV